MTYPLGFAQTQLFPTAITAAKPVVVTVVDHGLITNQYVRASNFIVNPSVDATGMYQLNNELFIVRVINDDDFALYTTRYEEVDGTNYTPFVNNGYAEFNLVGQDLDTQNLNQMTT